MVSTFAIYDSELNHIRTFNYKRNMTSVQSWWSGIRGDNENYNSDYEVAIQGSHENIIQEFQVDFLDFVQKQKASR